MEDVMRKLANVPLLICDFDGTLAKLCIDWNLLKSRLNEFAKKKGIVWQENKGIDDNLRKIRIEYGENIFSIFCDYIAKEEILSFNVNSICQNLCSVLHERKSKSCAIVSSNTRKALEKIFLHPVWKGLRPYIIGKEDVCHGKPDPEGLLKVCNYFQIYPNDALYIGDKQCDQMAAEAIGMAFLYISEIV